MNKKYIIFSVLVFLAGCYSVSRVIEPVIRLQIPRDQRLLIAVMNFENAGGDPENDALVKPVYARLVNELENTNKFRIIERKRLESVMEELNLGMTGLIDSGKMKEIGKLLGADAVLLGELSSVKYTHSKQSIFIMWTEGEKTTVSMNARLVNTETGELLASAGADAFVKQRNWVAFWFAKLGRKIDRKSVTDTAVELACKQLAIDISRKAYE